jgi:hypothetical protein
VVNFNKAVSGAVIIALFIIMLLLTNGETAFSEALGDPKSNNGVSTPQEDPNATFNYYVDCALVTLVVVFVCLVG